MKDRRIASFLLTTEVIEDSPEACRAVMGQCIVLRAETMWHMGAIEYTAISPLFAELPRGGIPPRVTWIVEDGKARLLD